MQALSKYILVRVKAAAPRENSLGLINSAVDVESERYQYAEVVLAGAECSSMICVGSTIAFDSAQGHNITINDESLRVITERDVAVVL